MLQTALAGTDVLLHSSGAAYLPEFRTLLIADAHFGKAVSFRRLGVPVPRGTTVQSLAQLSELAVLTGAAQIVFLGDFLHSARAQAAGTLAALADWRAQHSGLALTLVRGNHDNHAGDPPAALQMQVVDEPLALGPFALCHYPEPRAGRYVLAGHWHPCVSVSGRGRDRLRLPCFWFGDAQSHAVGVLPAFGQFTGKHPIDRRPGDRVFAVAGDTVQAIPEPEFLISR
jgi:uncharacterized protein